MLEDVSVYQIEPIIRIQGGKVGNEREGRIKKKKKGYSEPFKGPWASVIGRTTCCINRYNSPGGLASKVARRHSI